MELIQVEMVGLEDAEGVFQFRAGAGGVPAAGFAGEKGLVAKGQEGGAEEALCLALAVSGGDIEIIDAAFDCAGDLAVGRRLFLAHENDRPHPDDGKLDPIFVGPTGNGAEGVGGETGLNLRPVGEGGRRAGGEGELLEEVAPFHGFEFAGRGRRWPVKWKAVETALGGAQSGVAEVGGAPACSRPPKFVGLISPMKNLIPVCLLMAGLSLAGLEGRDEIVLPAAVLDLQNWKITLPVPAPDKPEQPWEIKQPKLAQFQVAPWFAPTADGTGVVFRASVVGVTTKGSKYPRSELREMAEGGKANAAWSSTEGTHTLFLEQAITATPRKKQEVVAGQIHDASRDIIFIRLEKSRLFVSVGGKNVCTLEENYVLGTRFRLRFRVEGGETAVFYNEGANPAYVLREDYTGAYFKAGVYTQSNLLTEKDPALGVPDNFGEVVLYRLEVSHRE